MILEVKNLTMSYDQKVLFKDASFRIFPNEKVGIVGANGVGKSTLIKILGHKIIPDQGSFEFAKNLKIGYLDQYLKVDKHITIMNYLKKAFSQDLAKAQEIEAINQQINQFRNDPNGDITNHDLLISLVKRATYLRDQLETNQYYAMDSMILRIASGLGINNYGMDQVLGHLSGGQKVKVILAKLLLEKPDLLIMDEPTNFLDTVHVDWLVKYLKEFKKAVLIVSHHQEFLNEVANVILDLDYGKITRYRGNYQAFELKKAQALENLERAYLNNQQQRAILTDYIKRNQAKTATARQAKDRQKKLDRLEVLEKPLANHKKIFLNFKYQPISSQRFLVVTDLEIGYYGSLLPKMSFEIKSGQRLAITGFNGIGKTTLLKTLVGQLPKISGQFKFVDDAKIAYFEQEHNFENQEMTCLEYIRQFHPLMDDKTIRSHLAKCALTGNLALQAVKTLSGGEQAKLKLCKMMLDQANVLIFDEPTNHLDSVAKECLLDTLKKYPGTVIIVSHEKEFIKEIATQVFNFEDLLV